MGFFAMLAEEYVLTNISLISCSPDRTNPGWSGQVSLATEYNINCINFTQSRMCGNRADESRNISTTCPAKCGSKSPAVGCNS